MKIFALNLFILQGLFLQNIQKSSANSSLYFLKQNQSEFSYLEKQIQKQKGKKNINQAQLTESQPLTPPINDQISLTRSSIKKNKMKINLKDNIGNNIRNKIKTNNQNKIFNFKTKVKKRWIRSR